ncbi:ABC transporter ATP-binding protein [Lutibaculum baratangense]|uniref:Putrescine transport ATP-binding protein PotA n=1 Tax=Lutibaculum baratangense AMV1 TaxID=631454 RepID=V4RN05_9HYPH|nr:ABC transporter ATP-binding protein [Lutibaculum baratangense]ESR27376.1 Putrescine transport ATP-binding protein PotA [Lutibaculum baratangense AMV1]
MADLVLENLTIAYGNVTAVRDVSLTIPKGEFLTLLGPSGCGKSTTLFAIAGLNHATSGRIALGERVFFDDRTGRSEPPERRNIGLVFQSYALWPHKTVADNLAFPLELRKVGRAERDRAIAEALDLVEMGAYARRYPFELSGGQQQRVALARALVYRPSLLLLDEPLSNLDAKLRERARVWLRELQERLNVTTIYVTHDQAEALAVSDRIAVMHNGTIRQLGTPTEIYEQPSDAFVADFIGSSNFLEGTVVERGASGSRVRLANGATIATSAAPGGPGEVLVAIRPERITLADGPGENTIPVTLGTGSYLGSVYQYEVSTPGLNFRIQTDRRVPQGDVFARIPPEATTLFLKSEAPVRNEEAAPVV